MKEDKTQKRGPGIGHVHQERRRDKVDESALERPQILVVVFPLMEIDLIVGFCGVRIPRKNRCVLLLAVEGSSCSPSRCVQSLTCGKRICISAGVGIDVRCYYVSPLCGGHDCFGSHPRGPLATRKTRTIRRENSCQLNVFVSWHQQLRRGDWSQLRSELLLGEDFEGRRRLSRTHD